MLPLSCEYDQDMLQDFTLGKIKPGEITEQLDEYLSQYREEFPNPTQAAHFQVYETGLLSELDRKSIEPMAIALLGAKHVRGLQHFIKRSTIPEVRLRHRHMEILAEMLDREDGFLSVDGSDFVKKGNNSAGVTRQHCGCLGKVENCQAGVFLSYASANGYGLLDGRLYIPKAWFGDDYRQKRERCQMPPTLTFKTKNVMASEMINEAVKSGTVKAKWIGCDAAFGCDHKFLASLSHVVVVVLFSVVRE